MKLEIRKPNPALYVNVETFAEMRTRRNELRKAIIMGEISRHDASNAVRLESQDLAQTLGQHAIVHRGGGIDPTRLEPTRKALA